LKLGISKIPLKTLYLRLEILSSRTLVAELCMRATEKKNLIMIVGMWGTLGRQFVETAETREHRIFLEGSCHETSERDAYPGTTLFGKWGDTREMAVEVGAQGQRQ